MKRYRKYSSKKRGTSYKYGVKIRKGKKRLRKYGVSRGGIRL